MEKIIRKIRNTHFMLNLEAYHLQHKGIRKSRKSALNEKEPSVTYPIDFVVTWVDGNDPEWRKLRRKYEIENIEAKGNTEARWRDWEIFQYWFRAVEKYAPWVRKVFLVTCGHVPEWLNLNADKLVVVRHDEFMPEKYLPTFNSNVIELNLHRIEGLSEHFVCFNDDVLLNSFVQPSQFFYGEFPKYPLINEFVFPTVENLAYRYMRYTDAGAINSIFNIRKCIEENCEKWFPYDSNRTVRRNNRNAYLEGRVLGLVSPHLYFPMKKVYMEQVWKRLPMQLDESCTHRFRRHNDYTLILAIYWYLCIGEVYPVSMDYCGQYLVPEDIKRVSEELLKEKHSVLCLNDSDGITEEQFIELKDKIKEMYEKKLPKKSDYEK